MNLRRKSIGSFVALALLGTAAQSQASIRPVDASSADRTIVLRTSDLRSAYLIRSGQVQYDANNLSPAGLQRQLQRHFDTVVALLMLNQGPSIELALDRLESRQSATWSSAERRAWRERLLASRRVQLVRLIEYRNRGFFPQNRGQAAGPVPIFIDAHDTACAVGHLMRLAGRGREVTGIERENNLVYVPDVAAGPVIAWTLTSGLTLEEAALIQPAYGPTLLPKPEHATEVMSSDASFEFENLRYSNFKLFAGDNPAAPAVNIPLTHTACSWFGCGPTFPVIFDVDPFRDITQMPDVELTLRSATPLTLEQSPPLLSSFPRVVVQFDVEVTAPGLRIANLPHGGSLMSNSYFDGSQFRLFVNESGDRLWIDQLHNPAPDCEEFFCGLMYGNTTTPGIRPEFIGVVGDPSPLNASFAPTQRLTVVTEMYLPPDQEFRGQFVNFSLVAVPEPATSLFVVLAFGITTITWPRARVG